MDLNHMFRVLWRFRMIVAIGLLLGFLLAFLAMVRVNLTSAPHFSYRNHPTYESSTNVFVTTPGFPFLSLTLRPGKHVADSPNGPVDIDNLRNAATFFVQYATGNGVMQELRKSGPIHGKLFALQVSGSDGSSLPLIGLAADAATPSGALQLAREHLAAFESWMLRNQIANGIPPKQRVILEPVSGPLPAKLLQARKITKPILIFTALLVLTCGLAFVLENMRPRIRPVEDEAEDSNRYSETRAKRLSA
jgi:hypothetical protein